MCIPSRETGCGGGTIYTVGVQMVPPKLPWQVPVSPDALVASALADGHPTVLAAHKPRLDGMPDAAVIERRGALRAAVFEFATSEPDVLARLRELDERAPDDTWTRWQTCVMLSGADHDPEVIALAQDVWEALGPNAFGVEFKERPYTYAGFVEGRSWMLLGLLGMGALVVASIEANDRGMSFWWALIPVAAAWPLLILLLFLSRVKKLERIAGRELPHF
jgi:hypothetical protein